MTICQIHLQKDRGHRHPESAPAQISPRACTQLAGKNFKRPHCDGSLEVAHHNTSFQPEVKIIERELIQ